VNTPDPRSDPPSNIKIVVAGGAEVGTTALITTISEVPPLTTRVVTPTITGTGSAQATGSVLDFGRTRLEQSRVVYLFGVRTRTPRPWAHWDDLCRSTAGVLVLVDPHHPESAGPALDYLTNRNLPHLVLAQPGNEPGVLDDLRGALALPPGTPVVGCDPHDRAQVHRVLRTLIDQALAPPKGSPCCPTLPISDSWSPLPSPCGWG
jgi:signal recognition particle receptor subunit beta